MQEIIFSVDKISGYIKNIFESESMLQNILISGEVSNYSESSNNAYFNLKGRESQINCIYFATDLRKYLPKNGDSCIVKGSVTYYKKTGKISFYVNDIRPFGQGDSYQKFLLLKDKLEKEGLFDVKFKKELPFFVYKLGVVTSRSGAVIHDIIKVATKRYKGIDILLYSVKVQGTDSEKEIAEGINILDKAGADVIIVARGGGSMEDLSPYNTETVARAVFKCNTPIVSAVGHQTDYTLCDLAADIRAATPTEAAEITVADALLYVTQVKNTLFKINKNIVSKFNYEHYNLKNTIKTMFNSVGNLIENYRADLKFKAYNVSFKTEKKFQTSHNFIENMLLLTEAKSPVKILQRGFSVVTDKKGKTINSVEGLIKGQAVDVVLQDGTFEAEVKDIKGRIS